MNINIKEYKELGDKLRKQRCWQEAANAYKQAIHIKPKWSNLYCLLAEVLKKQGDIDGAIANYQTAISLNPKVFRYHKSLGDILIKQNLLTEAINSYQQAIQLQPGNAHLYYLLGNLRKEQGDLDGAVENYQRAIFLNPEVLEYKETLGTIVNVQKLNIALNKPTTQSSVYRPEAYGYDPYGACNGRKNGRFGFSTCKENQPWWQIDLQGTYQLSEIKVYNRIGFEERASTLNVLLSQDALNWELSYSNDQKNIFGGIDGKPLTVNLHQKVARFVRLQLRDYEFLHLDEVEIYGIPFSGESLGLNCTQDESILVANFYGQDNLPLPPPIIKRIIAQRLDGMGTRLMCILSTRHICEYFNCKMSVSWPPIGSRYYSSNILHAESVREIFEEGKIFKDINTDLLINEDLSKVNTKSLSSFTKNCRRDGCLVILDKKATENLSQSEVVIYNEPWAIVPYDIEYKYGTEYQKVAKKIKDYWKQINWHQSIVKNLKSFENWINDRDYVVLHIRRGDIIDRLLYDEIEVLNRDILSIFGRFLPISTAVKLILDSSFKDVVICSECNKSTKLVVDAVKQINNSINFYITSNFTPSLTANQLAAYDLILMSASKQILTSYGSSFSTCAEFVGNTHRIRMAPDWENIAKELITYLDNNDNKMANERKSLVYFHISKRIQDKGLAGHYVSLSKHLSPETFAKFS
jgi:cytochrome c-type biogenesis protein CcmH/NrfG